MKKRIAVLLILLTVVVALFGCTNDNHNAGRTINAVNHRGYCTEAPENTLAAFRLSKEKGFTMVETDISFTADGVPVLLHDETVNRTSNGKGNVRKLTYQQLLLLDFGSWKSSKYAGEKIPTLEQFLQLCVELQLYPYLELKDGATEEEVALAANLVVQYNVPCTWLAQDQDILTQLAQIFPQGRFGLVVGVVSKMSVNFLQQLKTETNSVFLDCYHGLLVAYQIKMCADAGIPLEIWTLDNPDKIAKINVYISGITSNSHNAQEIFNNL